MASTTAPELFLVVEAIMAGRARRSAEPRQTPAYQPAESAARQTA